jgi:hypothetical protein
MFTLFNNISTAKVINCEMKCMINTQGSGRNGSLSIQGTTRDSSEDIAMGYGPGLNSWQSTIFPFSTAPRTAHRPTQPPFQ